MTLGHGQSLGIGMDGWGTKNAREVDGDLPESIPPVTVIFSPQHRLVELKVKHLLY